MSQSRSSRSNAFVTALRSLFSVRRRNTRTPCRLHLEYLEDRITPSVTVTTTLDPTTPIAGQLSLREAINMVNVGQVADNTIILPTGTYQDTQGALNVTHSLILQGAGSGSTSINGGGTDRVILIDPSAAVNVQISGVTVRDGKTSGSGGGINVQDVLGQASILTLNNCVVTGNEAGQSGGGINNFNGDINLHNCQIVNNKADSFEGGGVSLEKGGTDNLTVSNSTISGNSAAEGGGGVALLDNGGSGAMLTITGSTIDNNTVTTNTGDGGGGVVVNSSGTVLISDTTFSGNSAEPDGGAFESIFRAPNSITFINDTITGNSSTQGNGGGIATDNAATVTLQGCTLADNTASASGGGINDSGNGNLTIDTSTVSGNQAKGGSGGGVAYTGGGAVSIANSIFSGNTAGGAGINNFLSGGGLEVNNTAATVSIADSLFSGNIAQTGDGGGVDVFNGLTLTVTGSTFSGNQTKGVGFGGGLEIRTSGTNAAGTASSLIEDTITGNKSGNRGGGVEVLGSGYVNFVSDTINGNFAQNFGGGVRVAQGTAVFHNTIVAGNSVTVAANGNDISNVSTVVSEAGNFIGDNTTVANVFPTGNPNAGGDFAGTSANPLNPLLGPLQDNGGILAGAPGAQQIVPTEALLAGSPALGTGVANGALATDERGFNRVVNGHTDIGAFQFQNATLTVTVAPATPTVTINGSDSFTLTVTNTSGNALPADNSTLTVTLSNGLTTTSPLTFTLGALASGQSQTFTVNTTATALGTQTLTATVTSVDANNVTGSGMITVLANTPPPHSPIGALTLFGFGFGPTGIDLFEVDGKGDVFAQAFGFGGISGSPQFVATDAVFSNLSLRNGAIVGDILGGSGQPFLMEVLNFSDPFVFQGLLNAIFGK